MKYVLFGAGNYGKEALSFIDKKDIAYFVDNSNDKQKTDIDGIPVYSYSEKKQELHKYKIMITVSERYIDQVADQLRRDGISEFDLYRDLRFEKIREKINSRLDYIKIYKEGIDRLCKDIAEGCRNSCRPTFAETVGSCIPSFLRWGYREEAVQCAEWLCRTQDADGSWKSDADTEASAVFKTASIVGEGLMEARDIYPSAEQAIQKGCEWIFGRIQTGEDKLYWLFQIASLFYQAGDLEQGNRLFEYGCRLQNQSGGWEHICRREVAIKYFLDAFYYKIYALYNSRPYTFHKGIAKDDGRYTFIYKLAQSDKPLKVLDVGCGTGRYLKNLLEDAPQNTYYAVDFSQQVLNEIEERKIIKLWGRHCQLPFQDNEFDFVYSCEALCHVIDMETGIREMARVTKAGGVIAIVDKNKESYGVMDIAEWEQWFDEEELKEVMSKFCKEVKVYHAIPYEGKNDSLFSAWAGVVM